MENFIYCTLKRGLPVPLKVTNILLMQYLGTKVFETLPIGQKLTGNYIFI